MAMTLAEKILARASGRETVAPDEIVVAVVDLAMSHENADLVRNGAFATGIGATEMAGVWTEGRLWFKIPSTIRIEVAGELRPWVSAKDLILFIVGRLGADGADYRAVEFDGPVIRRMTVASRMVLANLAMEMGAKVAFTPVDETLCAYLAERAGERLVPGDRYAPDPGAGYERMLEIDAGAALDEPQVACPHAVDNVKPLSALGEVPVDQAVVGSCTNGRLEDLAVAARVLEGRRVHPRTRLLVIPASQQIYREAMRLGYLETFIAAGAMVNPPGCGPCVGGHQGILAAGEACISTTNRNFIGRMGSKDSQVYLASPAVVAASAVAGRIVHPETICEETAHERELSPAAR
ncbi:MAG: 3-isopropylmalate dehydratase large subunit [Acidobacteria bacterium]|nr:3-isopropylmalate dehydratase large subunit [Acidobacteriota bacterium]